MIQFLSRRGVTLIELIVVLVILGVIATIVGMGVQSASPSPKVNDFNAQVTALRTHAITTGKETTAVVVIDSFNSVQTGSVTAYPDGSVLSTIGDIERTTGKPRTP